MAKKINNKDFIEEGFGKPLIDFFKQLDDQIDSSKQNLKELASVLKKDVSNNNLKSGADVKALDKQKEQTEKIKQLYKEQTQAKKDLAKLAEIEAKKQAKIEQDRRKEIQKTVEFERRERIKLANDLIKQKKKEEAVNERVAQREKRVIEKKLLQQKKLIDRNKAERGSIKQLRQQLKLTTKSYDELSGAERRNDKVGGQLLTTLKKQRAELFKLEQATGRSQRDVGNYGKAFGRARLTIGKGLGILGIAGAVGSLGQVIASGIKTIKEYEQQMANVKAITGATEEEFQKLNKLARELGASTQFSAVEVAQLEQELAKLGFTTPQILDASEAILQLAVATGSDLAQSAKVAAATVNGFGLQAKDTQLVVDVMAKSFTSSALDLSKFETAMSAVAPVARVVGMSIQETTASLGVLVDAGFDASTAGTALRNILLDTQKAGISVSQAFNTIKKSADPSSAALDLFGKRGAAVALTLANSTDKTAEFTKKLMQAQGAAEAMAKVVGDTLEGDVKRLSSAWDDLILNLGDSSDGIFRDAVQGATDFIGVLGDLTENIHSQSDAVEEQRIELNALVQGITDVNTNEKERSKLIKELNVRYPKFLENLDEENVTNEQLATRLKEVNDQLVNKIIIQRENEKIEDAAKTLAEDRIDKAEEEIELRKRLNEINKEFQLGVDLNNINDLKTQFAVVATAAASARENVETSVSGAIESVELGSAILELSVLYGTLEGTIDDVKDSTEELNEASKNKEELLDSLGIKEKDYKEDILGTTKATKSNTAATKENNEVNEEKLGLLGTISKQTSDLRKEQQETNSPERILEIKKEIEDLEKKRKTLLGIEKATIKTRKANNKSKKNEVDDAERLAKLKERQLKKEIKERERAEKEKREQIKQTQKEALETGRKFLEAQNNARLESVNNSISESQKVQDKLTNLAASGNKEAAKSLASEAANQRKLETEREKTIKRQIAQAAILAGLELTISASRSGDTTPVATASNQVDALFKNTKDKSDSLLNNIGFFTGTEKVSEDLADSKFHDGKDGYSVRVHGTERILQGSDNMKLEGLSNEELTNAGVLYKKGAFNAHKYAGSINVIERSPKSSENELIKEVKDLKKAFIDGQKSIDFKIEPIQKHLVKETRTQGKLLRQHYKKGRLL